MKRLDDLDINPDAAVRRVDSLEKLSLQEKNRLKEKTRARARLERELKTTEIKPITYEGKRITCAKDLLKFVDL